MASSGECCSKLPPSPPIQFTTEKVSFCLNRCPLRPLLLSLNPRMNVPCVGGEGSRFEDYSSDYYGYNHNGQAGYRHGQAGYPRSPGYSGVPCCHRVVRYPPLSIADQTDSRRPRQNTPNNTSLLLIDINAFLRKTGQQLVEIV